MPNILGSVARSDLESLSENECRGFSFNEGSVFVIHHRQQFFAYRNHCPHLGTELEWRPDQFLDHAKQFIHCSTHGALFLINDGFCISGPCQGQTLIPVEIQFDDTQVHFVATL